MKIASWRTTVAGICAILVAVALNLPFTRDDYGAIVIGAVLISLLGAVDDALGIAPPLKFLGQAACAVIPVSPGVTIDHVTLPLIDPISIGVAQYPITLVFIVAIQVSVFREGAWLPILGYTFFSAVLTGSIVWWEPRILARRRAAEVLEDPVNAPERHRRARRKQLVWIVISQVFGWATMFVVLRFIAHKL